jgi:hypothetical protein
MRAGQAARFNAGAESLSGGTTVTLILDVVSPGRKQLGQWKTCRMVSARTKVD